MKKQTITTEYLQTTVDELSEADRLLVEKAKEATHTSYSPYSRFQVGAAVLLENNQIISGSNQENASYTTGTCAERCALFFANAAYPDVPVKAIAIAAQKGNDCYTEHPITPCGACRQVLAEAEHRFGKDFRVLLYGANEIYVFKSVADILPLQFSEEAL